MAVVALTVAGCQQTVVDHIKLAAGKFGVCM